MKDISKMHVCDVMAQIRKALNLSMDAMAKKLGYAGSSSYQHYEDAESYKKNYFETTFIQRLLKNLVPLGISEEIILQLGNPERENISHNVLLRDSEIALMDAIKSMMLIMTIMHPMAKTNLKKLIAFQLNEHEAHERYLAVDVLRSLLDSLNGKPLQSEFQAMLRLLERAPVGSA